MAGAPISFPTSTAPGVNTTENGGRLINAYAEPLSSGARNQYRWVRTPGLRPQTTVGALPCRGAIIVGSVLYAVVDDKAFSVTKAGAVYSITELTGTVGGSGNVIMARNMAADTQILIVHSDGMTLIEGGTAADFSDADLPAANSVTFMDGYFFVTSADGRVFASAINDSTFSAIDYATAESSPDGLVRAVAFGRDLLLMGTSTIEFWGNTGNATGFPFSRGPAVPVGLFGPYAVAGMESGFPEPLMWVANDRTVRRLVGYNPERVSSSVLERLLEQVTDPTTLEACAYVANGHAFWALSSPDWTWEFDLSTNAWHERKSYGANRWRAHQTVNAFDQWMAFDRATANLFKIDGSFKREGDQPLIWEVWSTQTHRFPGRIAVNRASFDFVTGVGDDRGISPIETDPQVSISWSDDGGRTFGTELLRALGTTGQQTTVDVFRAGLTGQRGRQWKLKVSDPVEVSLMGGAMDAAERLA